MLTVALNRVMSNTTQHGEPRVFTDTEALSHPREEMSQAVVAALDALRNTRASARERQRSDAVRPKYHSRIRVSQVRLGFQYVFRPAIADAANDIAIGEQLQSRHFYSNLELRGNELANGRRNLPCTRKYDECTRLSHLEINGLS